MIGYLKDESQFLKTLGNRCLLLLFLAALTRVGHVQSGNVGLLGVSVSVSQGYIIIGGPVICLLMLSSLYPESRMLLVGRGLLGEEVKYLPTNVLYKLSAVSMFYFPCLAASFFVIQYVTNLVPASETCVFSRLRHFYDVTLWASPSMFCIGDRVIDMPWIYTPIQVWLYLGFVLLCGFVGEAMRRDWMRNRAASA